MKRNEIIEAIRQLSYGQGFYGRLLRQIMEAENKDEILLELENHNFKDVLEMIFYFEC